LPVLDLALRPQSRIAVRPETCRLYYSYDAAKGDPESFGRWELYYAAQFDHLGNDVFMRDPEHQYPFRLRPGSHTTMIRCPISINSLGFRGPEIAPAKNGVYRIVALGESTTFGMTIGPEDKSWPEALEQIIRQRLKTRRPVQVINAGVPDYSIYDNLRRLPREILPLHPDMIISYHGANGFHTLESSVLPPVGSVPPVYKERPVKLAAEAEHRWRMRLFERRARRRRLAAGPPSRRPLETQYAAAYRQLIQCARTNGIRLALANFSMAVNQASDPRVIDFYQGGGPREAYGFMPANNIHSLIVSQLAAENPDICLVDTHPHLDGEHEKFIDVIHLTGEGDRQLAENMFAGIRQTLEHDLAAP
jgi:lysophospholipase L1-like esterase